MKKAIMVTLSLLVSTSAVVSAGGFEKRYQMMDSRIHSKMEKFAGNAEAQKFLKTKLACVKAAKVEQDLKDCKKKHPPQELKAIVSK